MQKALILSLALVAASQVAVAETVSQQAENQVPVTAVEVSTGPNFTEVHLQTQAALQSVCWFASGPNSPYLLSSEHRYRFISSNNVALCPTTENYAANDVMVLRFEPLPAGTTEFSLVEGQGGENQLVNPLGSTVRYWNFLHIKLTGAP
jgi:hypothetical protein